MNRLDSADRTHAGRGLAPDTAEIMSDSKHNTAADLESPFLDEEIVALPMAAGAATEASGRSREALRRAPAVIAAAWRRGSWSTGMKC